MGGQSIATKVKYISSIENPMETLLSSPCQCRFESSWLKSYITETKNCSTNKK